MSEKKRPNFPEAPSHPRHNDYPKNRPSETQRKKNKPIVVIGDIEELIERDTPMKPLKVNNTKLTYWCSKCDCSSIQRYDKFCHECGQRLDWS